MMGKDTASQSQTQSHCQAFVNQVHGNLPGLQYLISYDVSISSSSRVRLSFIDNWSVGVIDS